MLRLHDYFAVEYYINLTHARRFTGGFVDIPLEDWSKLNGTEVFQIRFARLWAFYQSTMSMDAF